MAASKKAVRSLTILKRAEIKKASRDYSVQPGDLIFIVKTDKEDIYTTTLRNNGKPSCTCKANACFGRKCYHITYCECQTNYRRESAKLAPNFAAKSVPMWTLWLIESGVLVAPKPVEASKAIKEEDEDILDAHARLMRAGAYTKKPIENASLNGNRGFSILKSAS